uniref:Methyltransferase type 11 domain-containing protein n=1 Tax=Aplanochytrium stocchinoi TaxID=215587 RepID=A0A7S3PG40_9STRA
MIIVGRRQNQDVETMVWKHALAEKSCLAANSIDAVQIHLVLHECREEAKVKIGKEVNWILRPGGQFVITDTPQNGLATYRGFLESHTDLGLSLILRNTLKLVVSIMMAVFQWLVVKKTILKKEPLIVRLHRLAQSDKMNGIQSFRYQLYLF